MSNEQTIKTAINYLKEHPFTVIQLSDKEKFHTGMFCFTLNKYPSLFKTIFELEGKGGFQDLGETPAKCAIRECKEETGFDIKLNQLLGVWSSNCYEYINYP